MRSSFAALAAVLALALPAAAEQVVVTAAFKKPSPATLANTNDAATVQLPAGQFASAYVITDGVWNGTCQQESTNDGKNWISGPYAKLISTAASNPAVTSSIVNAAAAATYEVPLPGNALAFRCRQTAGTAAGTVTVQGGVVYVPGVPVIATLYDVTSATNTALDTGTVDVSGWTWLHVFQQVASGSGPVGAQLAEVDDAGVSPSSYNSLYGNGSLATQAVYGIGPGLLSLGGTANATGLLLPRRVRGQMTAASSTTTRIRLVVRR